MNDYTGTKEAFPLAWDENSQLANLGLTKREFFAAIALQGLLAHPAGGIPEIEAERAVKTADALIAALSRQNAEALISKGSDDIQGE